MSLRCPPGFTGGVWNMTALAVTFGRSANTHDQTRDTSPRIAENHDDDHHHHHQCLSVLVWEICRCIAVNLPGPAYGIGEAALLVE